MIQFELETDRKLFEDTLRFAKQQVHGLIEREPDYYPIHTDDGKWRHDRPVWTHWCDGFLTRHHVDLPPPERECQLRWRLVVRTSRPLHQAARAT